MQKEKRPLMDADEARGKILALVTRDGAKNDPKALCYVQIGRREWRVEVQGEKGKQDLLVTTKGAVSAEDLEKAREVFSLLCGGKTTPKLPEVVKKK